MACLVVALNIELDLLAREGADSAFANQSSSVPPSSPWDPIDDLLDQHLDYMKDESAWMWMWKATMQMCWAKMEQADNHSEATTSEWNTVVPHQNSLTQKR